ncbi:DUF4186 domain-containing protein [Gluconacetobacter sacchari]|uniref:DUF4186 domain-containing protein n=2 Tax=Gluconacetobacter sacchari TaxID=92759 RepID=A0A7W4ICB6_9PROT|nr:DUF4186 domain-containing protein [Gluconacetobacter sacchari]MBB2160266.1 DUF4186 domain-containing protein [Gluconacetobacter sacchari]GBQ28802.1 hypothetical protein AA12717_3063 [Gluconacetobacter sacchari DSM 12717]
MGGGVGAGDTPPPPIPDALWQGLARSAFRARFHLDAKDRAYLKDKGLPTVMEHAADFITRRLAPAHPARDGRQTPWRGHPVFVAQHATATCCRGCLEKWHGLAKGQQLDAPDRAYVLTIIRTWLEREQA